MGETRKFRHVKLIHQEMKCFLMFILMGLLYFSSNGHVGLGGLDIFKAQLQPDGHWKVENMRCPINSPYDDFGIVFQPNEERGMFSSTRNGRDDDIFSFVLPPLKFNITGIIKDERTDQPLADATVKMYWQRWCNKRYKNK